MVNIPICQDIPMIKPIEATVAVIQSVDKVKGQFEECKARLTVLQEQIDPKSPEYILFGRMINSVGSMYVDLGKFQKSAREAYSRS